MPALQGGVFALAKGVTAQKPNAIDPDLVR